EAALGVALALVCATATSSVGVHVVVGAFVAGVIVRGVLPRQDRGLARIDRFNRGLILPVFFASVGLTTDVGGAIAKPSLLAAGAVMLLVAIAGKLVAPCLVARLGGMEWRDALGLGVLLNTKGLTEIVVLKTGLELGLLSKGVFTILLLLALVTPPAA